MANVGTINGTLTDSQTGEGLSGTVTAKNNSTGTTMSTKTSGTWGEFRFENIAVGTYTLTGGGVSGYGSVEVPSLKVPQGAEIDIDLTLTGDYTRD